jgi:predicted nucleic acid-binding protein
MKYLLDTNICVFVIRRKSTGVVARPEQHATEEIVISAVTLGELRYETWAIWIFCSSTRSPRTTSD